MTLKELKALVDDMLNPCDAEGDDSYLDALEEVTGTLFHLTELPRSQFVAWHAVCEAKGVDGKRALDRLFEHAIQEQCKQHLATVEAWAQADIARRLETVQLVANGPAVSVFDDY